MSDAGHIVAGLTSFWLGTRELNLATIERYYDGTQTIDDNAMLTAEQRKRADVTRFFKPVNYLAAVVDEPIGYLAHGSLRIEAGGNERLVAWAQDFHQRRIKPRRDDAVRWQGLFGEVYLYLWTDKEGSSKGLKLDVIPPIEGGSRRVIADYDGQDPEELTHAILYKRVPIDSRGGFDEYRITVDPNSVKVERRRISRSMHGTVLGQGWELISEEPNPSGVLPVVPLFNSVASDALNIITVQDDLDKLHLDMRLAREYGGYPMLTTDAAEIPDDLQVGPGRILFGGTFGQIAPSSIQAFLDERKALLESMAKIGKSVTLLTEAGTDESGVALKFRQQSFLEKLESKAQRLATSDELLLAAAARIMSVDEEIYEMETRRLPADQRPSRAELADAEFSVQIGPALPADELAQAQVAQIWDSIGLSRETVYAKAGVENPSEEVLAVEKEQASMVERARARLSLERGALPEVEEEEEEDEEEGS